MSFFFTEMSFFFIGNLFRILLGGGCAASSMAAATKEREEGGGEGEAVELDAFRFLDDGSARGDYVADPEEARSTNSSFG